MSRLESDYYSYMGYDPDNAKAGLRHYLPFFDGGPVLELACGRGEFLEVLAEAGIDGEGVDSDEGMVEKARAAGLRVSLTDAITAIEQRPDDSLRGVFSAHFAEHLPPDVLEHVIAESARALAPGGVFVAATPNAACLSVLGHDFWRDPTHIRFYEPRLLAFYCAKAGMEVVETGGNPLNHPGPPPESLAPPVHVDPDLRGDMVAAIQHIHDKKHGEDWQSFGHFLGVIEERLRTTQEELVGLRRSYAHLLDRLYPSNEVYVVARAV
jgi:SAM-dependent methyltransferase